MYNNRENTNVKNNIRLDKDNNVCAYEKGAGGEDFFYVDSGVLFLKKEVLNNIPRGANRSLEFDVFPQLIENSNMVAHIVNTRFYDIGTPERLKEAELFFKSWSMRK